MNKLKWIDIANIEGEIKGPPLRTSWLLVAEKTTGSQSVSVGMNETQVGSMVPEHKHEKEEEIMFFLQGKGQFITKDEVIDLKPGICVYNPPGALHSIINTGDEILRFLWIYAPQLDSHRL
jgi:putative monooxygenase